MLKLTTGIFFWNSIVLVVRALISQYECKTLACQFLTKLVEGVLYSDAGVTAAYLLLQIGKLFNETCLVRIG